MKLPFVDRARRVAQRIGLIDAIPPGLAPGAPAPRHVFRWDLDKTYLRTEFDSVGDLVKSAIENAADKQAFPGAPALLRALHQDEHRICIVSGSPTQMRHGAGRQARARRRRLRRVRPQEQPQATSCAVGSAHCAPRSPTSCRRMLAQPHRRRARRRRRPCLATTRRPTRSCIACTQIWSPTSVDA
jgi:hypothetical protein